MHPQTKLDLGSQARLRTPAVSRTADGQMRVAPRTGTLLRGFITLADGATADELSTLGVTVNSVRGHRVVAEFDRTLLPLLETSEAIASINLEKPVARKLDRARTLTGTDRIHAGENLPRAYTGKGVVAGIVDGGFDPNHINFRHADGTTRIGQFCYYRPTQTGDRVEQIVGPDIVPEIDTEDDNNFHGTHTLGIMAGGYRGKITAGVHDGTTASVSEIDNPYYGIAYDSEIAIASGAVSDYYVALGIETILDHAYYNCNRAPAVINLSLGSNLGPHDGTSALCEYIDEVSALDRVIICMASGNEGALPICVSKTLTSDADPLLTCFELPQPEEEFPNVRAGQTYIYSDTEKPFTVQAIVINKARDGRVALRMPLGETEGAMKYWVTSAEYQSGSDDIVSPQLGNWFKGYVGVGAMKDEASGRYYAVIDCMLWDNTDGNPDGNYILGLQVDGAAGQRIDIYGDGQFNQFSSMGFEGYSDGRTDGTVSDLATGKSTVVVGAYNSRNTWASLDGKSYSFGEGVMPEGAISDYTSWGTLIDGRKLPHVCAPGTAIISSSNKYYIDKQGLTKRDLQGSLEADGREYSWHQQAGTSMATPVVSGAIALWLEADPDLKAGDVIEIIAKTSVRDEAVSTTGNPVQWGAGKFDAYAGLKEVLARSTGIAGPAADDAGSRLMVTPAGARSYEIFLAGAPGIDAVVHNIAGVRVLSLKADGPQALLDASALAPGIYILTVNGQSTRIAVR